MAADSDGKNTGWLGLDGTFAVGPSQWLSVQGNTMHPCADVFKVCGPLAALIWYADSG